MLSGFLMEYRNTTMWTKKRISIRDFQKKLLILYCISNNVILIHENLKKLCSICSSPMTCCFFTEINGLYRNIIDYKQNKCSASTGYTDMSISFTCTNTQNFTTCCLNTLQNTMFQLVLQTLTCMIMTSYIMAPRCEGWGWLTS